MTAAQPAAILTARYARAFNVAVIVVVAGWHVAGAGSQLAAHLRDYSSGIVQIAAWVVLALAVAAGAVHLLRGSSGPGWAWGLCGVALVTSTIIAVTCPPGRMLETDWAWGTAGWIGVLALLRRPLTELAGFLALEALATLGVLVGDDPHRLALAGFITVLCASAGLQLATGVAARALDVTARQAADAATREAAASGRKVIADRLYAARRSRWLGLRRTLEPLLAAWPPASRIQVTMACGAGAQWRRPGCGGCSPRATTRLTPWSTNCTPAPTSRSGAGWRWTWRPWEWSP